MSGDWKPAGNHPWKSKNCLLFPGDSYMLEDMEYDPTQCIYKRDNDEVSAAEYYAQLGINGRRLL